MNARMMRRLQAKYATKWNKRPRPNIPRKSQHDTPVAEYVERYCELNHLTK